MEDGGQRNGETGETARWGRQRKHDNLPGFAFDDCVPFTGDSVKAPVRFREAKIADLPKDKFLILRFEVCAGEVFGYEWI